MHSRARAKPTNCCLGREWTRRSRGVSRRGVTLCVRACKVPAAFSPFDKHTAQTCARCTANNREQKVPNAAEHQQATLRVCDTCICAVLVWLVVLIEACGVRNPSSLHLCHIHVEWNFKGRLDQVWIPRLYSYFRLFVFCRGTPGKSRYQTTCKLLETTSQPCVAAGAAAGRTKRVSHVRGVLL